LEQADCIVAAKRFLPLVSAKRKIRIRSISALLSDLPSMLEQESVGLIVSGDPLLYSLYRTIATRYPDLPVQLLPGVGSLQILGAAFGLTMEDAAIRSIHGRTCTDGTIARTVAEHPVTFFFCAKEQGPREIAKALHAYHLDDTELFVGANLTAPDERLYRGTPEVLAEQENPELCVTAVRNAHPNPTCRPALLPDRAFLRNESPMTKEEVRAVILMKLQLKPDAVVWDLGAGTGSISIECARICVYGTVCAVEYQKAALDILHQNKAYFQTGNLRIVAGRALEQLATLPLPDCIFIGGSDRELPALLRAITALPRSIRLVVSAVTLETQAEAYAGMQHLPEFDAIQLSVSHAKPVGRYRVLEGNHPVMLFSAVTPDMTKRRNTP
jgi:precorrin-6Y C5,15-methyltransferase (decarboxylating)